VPHAEIEDVHARPDTRCIAIDQVGVRDLCYPIVVLDRAKGRQHTVATVSMAVSLPHHFKGTHMSRFIEVLNEHRGEVTLHTLPALLADLRTRLDAESAHVEVAFPYFIERVAPVSGARSLLDYACTFVAEAAGAETDFMLSVRCPVTSLCPCSKAISDYGAHNQRGYLTIAVRGARREHSMREFVWIEDLVAVADCAASAPIYPLLKRPDERHVTMQAYDHPVFVEDMVRNAAEQLMADSRVAWFRVHAENHESIHQHNAYAQLEWARPG
jgi:GTP cyclohydrolase I